MPSKISTLRIVWCIIFAMRRCNKCHSPISSTRLEALPQTRVCVECSTEVPVVGYMSWEHKTAPVIQVVNTKEFATYQRYDRKGVRSGLPMSPRTVSGTSGSITPVFYADDASNTMVIRRNDAEVPRARCPHTDRPQVSAAGKCLECAMAYYAVRVNGNVMPTKS